MSDEELSWGDEPSRDEMQRRHRAVAALLGFALGDAYGVAVSRGEQPFTGARAEVSDATQMMLACCEGLLRGHVRARVGLKQPTVEGQVWFALVRWGASQGDLKVPPPPDEAEWVGKPAWLSEQPVMGIRNRHGSAISRALASGSFFGPGRSTGSAGSAALFRVAPVSLCSFGEDDVRSAVALTHDAPGAILAAVALHRIIRETFLSEHPLRERVVSVAGGLKEEPEGAGLAAALQHAIPTSPFTVPQSMPAYTAQGTLVRAVRAAARPESLPAALANATAGRTHDVTSLGAITGLLASLELARDLEPRDTDDSGGGIYGFGSGTQLVPADWLKQLVGREVVERMAADLQRISFDTRIDADIVTRYPGV